MKAIRYYRFGPPDALALEDVAKPVPADNEVLIKVHAASVNPLDWHFMRGLPYLMRMMAGLRKPKDSRLGVDFAGEVEAIGKSVTQFKPGDEVFGVCRGAFAEYACAKESEMVTKPANISFEQAAAVTVAAMTALQALREKGKLQAGQSVLINGAAGGVGTFAVQIAKAFGAEVTGVCSGRNADMVRSIGADRVIDYTQEDFTNSDQRYDVFLDCMGNRPVLACKRILKPAGVYIVIGGPKGDWVGPLIPLIKLLLLSPFVSQRLTPMLAKANKDDLTSLRDLIAAGKITPVIDRSYPLNETAEAVRYVEEGHARGKVVITPR